MTAPETTYGWNAARQTLTRRYPVTVPMVALMLLVPVYIFIADFNRGRAMNRPELSLDRLVPLVPEWALVYGALYLFLILLPVFVIARKSTSAARFWHTSQSG